MAHPEYKNIGTPEIRVIEECSELIKIICKAERFGLDTCHPNLVDVPGNTNRQRILLEIDDVIDTCKVLRTKIS